MAQESYCWIASDDRLRIFESMIEEPLFPWLKERGAGILLHPTSLPSREGIGTLGAAAHRWLEVLEHCGMRYWQVLPLGPTGYGDSPYQSFSAFAGNPYLIDLESLLEMGLLDYADLSNLHRLPQDRVDYGALYQAKWPLLRLAYRRFREKQMAYLPNYGLFADFLRRHQDWLLPYAGFMALKDYFGGSAWSAWPAAMRHLKSARESSLWKNLASEMEAFAFYQYLFFGQWKLLRQAAHRHGIAIIGDLPIFVSFDSADVWSRPELFELDAEGMPLAVAGVPPDYFSATGQLWGNPLYRWDILAADGYDWWKRRLRAAFDLVDIVRLDHFRGFYAYWRIPYPADTAITGAWVEGPAMDFFRALKADLPDACIIAEDLGIIPPEVRRFLAQTGLPGMAILQFAFDGDPQNLYLPHNLSANCVLYPGTHDNDTTAGWYTNTDEKTRDMVRRYFRISGQEIGWDFIRAGMAATPRLAIFPFQDFFQLNSQARMNTPGVAAGNWQFRCTQEQINHLEAHNAAYLQEIAHLYGRLPPRKNLPQNTSIPTF